MVGRYFVEFYGEVPDNIAVGDELNISGRATVKTIDAALVDVTRYGSDPEFVLGEATINLVSNRFSVTTD